MQFKVGDIIELTSDNYQGGIVKGKKAKIFEVFSQTYLLSKMNDFEETAGIWTEEELKRAGAKLVKSGNRWKPEVGEEYYVATGCGDTFFCIWRDDDGDNVYYDLGNCFQTEEQAQQFADEIKELAKKYV